MKTFDDWRDSNAWRYWDEWKTVKREVLASGSNYVRWIQEKYSHCTPTERSES